MSNSWILLAVISIVFGLTGGSVHVGSALVFGEETAYANAAEPSDSAGDQVDLIIPTIASAALDDSLYEGTVGQSESVREECEGQGGTWQGDRESPDGSGGVRPPLVPVRSGSDNANHTASELMVLVSTFNGDLFGLAFNGTTRISRNGSEVLDVRLEQRWKTTLIRDPVFKASMNSTFFYKGEPIVLVPSLQGGLFTLRGDDIQAMPFTSDHLLDANTALSENSSISGIKTSEIVKIDVDSGNVLYRSGTDASKCEYDVYGDASVASDAHCGLQSAVDDGSDTGSGSGDELASGADRSVNAPARGRTQSKAVSAAFKLTSRHVQADDIEACRQKWYFKTVDLKCMASRESVCDKYLSSHVLHISGKDGGGLSVGLDSLVHSLSVSLVNGHVCSKWPPGNGIEGDAATKDGHCVGLNSSLVKAWLAVVSPDRPSGSREALRRLVCVQELDLLALSTFSIDKRYAANMSGSDGEPGMTRARGSCADAKEADGVHDPSSGRGKTDQTELPAHCQGEVGRSAVVFIGNAQQTSSGGGHHLYLLVSDRNMRVLLERARHNVLRLASQGATDVFQSQSPLLVASSSLGGEQSAGDGAAKAINETGGGCNERILNEESLVSALYHAHDYSDADDDNQALALVLYDKSLLELKRRGVVILIPTCCAVDVYVGQDWGNAEPIVVALHDRSKEFVIADQMQLSFDQLYISCASLVSVLSCLACVLFRSAAGTLCGAFPYEQLSDMLEAWVAKAIYFLCLLAVSIWTRKSIPSCQAEFIRHMDGAHQGPMSTYWEFQRWIYVRFVVSLWVEYSSRYEKEYTHVRCLGKGGFGVVFEAINRLDTRSVAIKRIMFTSEPSKEILQEVRFLAMIEHPNVVYYHCGWFELPPIGWQHERDKVLIKPYLTSEDDSSSSSELDEGASGDEGLTDLSASSTLQFTGSCEQESSESKRRGEALRDSSPGAAKEERNVPLASAEGNSFEIVFDRGVCEKPSSAEMAESDEDSQSSDISGSGDTMTESDEDYGIEQVEHRKPALAECEAQESATAGTECRGDGQTKKLRESETSGLETASTGSCLSPQRSACESDDEYVFTAQSDDDDEQAEHLRALMQDRDAARHRLYPCLDMGKDMNENRPGYLYFCMELCRPDTLREWLQNSAEERSINDSIWYFIQICRGVRYLHHCELIHRDLKPSNILFSRYDGSNVKIGDFGLMVRVNPTSASETGECAVEGGKEEAAVSSIDRPASAVSKTRKGGSKLVVGTELYISPEQFESPHLPINKSIDIYSLGIILFELLYPFSTNMERVMMLRCLRNYCFTHDFKNQKRSDAPCRGNAPKGFTMREVKALDRFIKEKPLEWTVVRWLLSKDPGARPSAKELLTCRPLVEMAYKHLDAKRFAKTGWIRARCTSFSQTSP